MRIVLGVTGGVAAYKAVYLLRNFVEAGHKVSVIVTENALKFVGEATWAALSGEKVYTDTFVDVEHVTHIRLAQEADLLVVAPATANFLAKARFGLVNDLLTNTLLATKAAILFAPAMHTEMWLHPSVVENVAVLRERNVTVLEPAVGRLTGKDSGVGRLPDPEKIFLAAMGLVSNKPTQDLLGKKILITVGSTREPIDPVRFLGNNSSGKQGMALAAEAVARGGEVFVVAGFLETSPAEGINLLCVSTALQMHKTVMDLLQKHSFEVVVMAAAVADYRPKNFVSTKIKKQDKSFTEIVLTTNVDILSEIVSYRNEHNIRQIVVGFAAETGDANCVSFEYAQEKFYKKACDMLVFNEVGREQVFGLDKTNVRIFSENNLFPEKILGTKKEVSNIIWNNIYTKLVS